jgi:hypothetical protein
MRKNDTDLVSSPRREGEERETSKTHVLVLHSLELDKVRRSAVTPPELTGDAPVELSLQPAVPVAFGLSGTDLEFAGAGALCGEGVSMERKRGERREWEEVEGGRKRKGRRRTEDAP